MIEMSAEISRISKALVGAQADVGIALKNQENAHFKSQYADLPAVLEVATPALAKHGLALIQCPGEGAGTAMSLTSLLIHESGEWMLLPPASMPLQAQTAHAYGSALSYLRRYTTQACLKISIGSDDDDGNEATAQAPKARVSKPKPANPDRYAPLTEKMLDYKKENPDKLNQSLKELTYLITACEEVGSIDLRHIDLAKTVVGLGGGGIENKQPIERVESAITYLSKLLDGAS